MTARAGRWRAVIAALLVGSAPAAAQLRGVEAEGAVPVPAAAFDAATLRIQAQSEALREAVLQVALALVAPPAVTPETPPPAAASPFPAPAAGAAPGAQASAERLRKAFEGSAPLDFTSRYRVVQDLGVRPRRLLENPTVSQEYAVRVEAQIDTGRVRRKLAAAGLLPAAPTEGGAAVVARSFRVVVEGLASAGALSDVRQALAERTGAGQVLPISISASEVVLEISGGQLGGEPSTTLQGPVGSALWLELVPAGEPGAPLRFRAAAPPPSAAAGMAPASAGSGSTPLLRPVAPSPSSAPRLRPD